MSKTESITLSRDCKATAVPQGMTAVIQRGTEVKILQSVGDAHTVIGPRGQMLRIAGEDSDALGIEPPKKPEASAAATADGDSVRELCMAQLRTCYDPEFPVDIVELGLVYVCQVTPLEGGGSEVMVLMTLTSPACGMGDLMVGEVEMKLAEVPGVDEVKVEIVFDPPWDMDRMSDAARLELGMM